MAKTGTRIYVDSDSGTGLTISEIKSVLGDSSLDLGTLCKSSNINPLAKYKPVNVASWGEITEAQRKAVNYGLTAPSSDASYSVAITRQWTYTKPNGYYRALDFDGYKHDATFLIKCRDNEINLVVQNPTSQPYLYSNVQGEMELADFGTLSSWYACLVLTYGSKTYYKTADKTMGDGGTVMNFTGTEAATITNRAAGTIKYYVLFCDTAITTMSQTLTGAPKFLPLPWFSGESYPYHGNIVVKTTYSGVPDGVTLKVQSVAAVSVPTTSTTFTTSPPIPQNLLDAGCTTNQWGGYFGVPGTPPTGTSLTVDDMVGYFKVSSYSACFKILVTNNNSTAFTLETTRFKANLSKTFATSSKVEHIPVTVYDTNINAVASLNVPANSSKTYIFSLPASALAYSSSSSVGVSSGNQKLRISLSIVEQFTNGDGMVCSFPMFNCMNY